MNWTQLIRGSQTKHRKLWRPSKAKSCLGGDVHFIKIQCHHYLSIFFPEEHKQAATTTTTLSLLHQHEEKMDSTSGQSL